MSTEMVTALSALSVALITAGGGVVTVVIGRRQPRGQSRRDDFTTVTTRMDKDIDRLERRLRDQEKEMERAQDRIVGQSAAIAWLTTRLRGLVAYARASGLEPPAPAPIPDRAREYISDIDV